MNWIEILGIILGGSGVIGGGVAIYNAKADKESIVIKNLSDVINEIRKTHEEYKKETDSKLEKLEVKVDRMERRDRIHTHVINQAYLCRQITTPEDCPVLSCINKNHNELEGQEQ